MKLRPRDIVFERVLHLPWSGRVRNLMTRLALLGCIMAVSVVLSAGTYALWELMIGHEVIFSKDPLLEEAIKLDTFAHKHREALIRFREIIQSSYMVLNRRT